MDSMNKNLSQFFNVPVQPDSKPTAIAGGTFNNNNFQKDYELVQGNLNLTSRAPTSSNQQQTPGVQVMDASQVKTMKSGGSVVIGKGKDYIKDLLNNGSIALESALKVATESDSPRAFEVVAILLKTLADLNNNVIDVHKKVKDTTAVKTEIKQTNNSVFLGSTTDLQNILNKDRSTNKIIDAEIVNNEPKQ